VRALPRGPGARGSDLDASDASKTRASRSIPEPQRVTRNHDLFSVARLASGSHNVPRRHACTRPKPTPPLTTMALTLPTDHFFRDAFREADDVRPSRLSRHRSPRVTLQAARRRFRRHREEGSLSDLPLPSPDTQWFSNFLAPSGVMIPMSGAPHERARSSLRIIPVDVTVRPPRLPRPSSARRCFFEAFFRGRLSTGPRNKKPGRVSRLASRLSQTRTKTGDQRRVPAQG